MGLEEDGGGRKGRKKKRPGLCLRHSDTSIICRFIYMCALHNDWTDNQNTHAQQVASGAFSLLAANVLTVK